MAELDSKPEIVNNHFASLGNLPMGKYFEQLLFFILEKDARFELLLKNHQLIKDKQTVGEIDLILKDNKTEVVEHWEIALKYYLQSQESEDHAVMLGPNANDNLEKKMIKLNERQLFLTEHTCIPSTFQSYNIENKLFMKGQLFYHLNNRRILPAHTNPCHETGWWCFNSESDSILEDRYLWTIIQKPEWIGHYSCSDNTQLLSCNHLKNTLQSHFQEQNRSVFCIGLLNDDGIWKEATRGFVVNNDWPDINASGS